MVLVLKQRLLESCAGKQIPNILRTPQDPSLLNNRIKVLLADHPGVTIRSRDTTYNCLGLAFANRRTSIEPSDLRQLLADDDYRPTTRADAMSGDLVLYSAFGELSHVAIVTHRPTADPSIIWVMSAWGSDGEYTHVVDNVPTILGNATEFWTDRK